MERRFLKLIDKRELSPSGSIRLMRFDAPGIEAAPGQFVNIAVEGKYLRRPISVCDYSNGILSLVISVVGEGTRRITDTPEGVALDMLTGLGNTFSSEPQGRKTALLGGGVGYAPLVGQMRRLRANGHDAVCFFGFNSREEMPERHINLLVEEFGRERVVCSTMDGSTAYKGNPLEAMNEYGFKPDYYYACGPMPMLRAAALSLSVRGEVSLEARMGCGFGACMGCTIETLHGPRRICKEGPVFMADEVFDFEKK